MQTIEIVEHLDHQSFMEKVVETHVILELTAVDIELKAQKEGYSITTFGDWYKYGIEQTINQQEYKDIDYSCRKNGISYLIQLIWKNMLKWFSKNEEKDPTRVRQRVNYNNHIRELTTPIEIESEKVVNNAPQYRKKLMELISQNIDSAKKIRRKIYHFFNRNSKTKKKYLEFIKLIIRNLSFVNNDEPDKNEETKLINNTPIKGLTNIIKTASSCLQDVCKIFKQNNEKIKQVYKAPPIDIFLTNLFLGVRVESI